MLIAMIVLAVIFMFCKSVSDDMNHQKIHGHNRLNCPKCKVSGH